MMVRTRSGKGKVSNAKPPRAKAARAVASSSPYDDEDDDVFINPKWELTTPIAPSYRGLLIEALHRCQLQVKDTLTGLSTLDLPDLPVRVLASHRLVLSTQLKQSQEGAPIRFAVKSLRALNAGLNICETRLKKIRTDQTVLGIYEPNDTDAQITALAELRRHVGVQRDLSMEESGTATGKSRS